jgi:hypothetical protein
MITVVTPISRIIAKPIIRTAADQWKPLAETAGDVGKENSPIIGKRAAGKLFRIDERVIGEIPSRVHRRADRELQRNPAINQSGQITRSSHDLQPKNADGAAS